MPTIGPKRRVKSSSARDWWVYIVSCRDGSYYTGITKDVAKRVLAHNLGKGASYTRGRRPVSLLYSCKGYTRSSASVREAEIKALARAQKTSLIAKSKGKKGKRKRGR